MMNYKKYHRGYYMPPEESLEWTKKEYIDKYQLIQRIVRYKNFYTKKYYQSLKMADSNKCTEALEQLMSFLKKIKHDESKHYYFNNDATGENCTIVMRVLEYCVNHNCLPTRWQIYYQTGGWKKTITPQDVFVQEAIYRQMTADEQAKYDPRKLIKLPNGTAIIPWKNWEKGIKGNTLAFIDDVSNRMNRNRINTRVSIL